MCIKLLLGSAEVIVCLPVFCLSGKLCSTAKSSSFEYLLIKPTIHSGFCVAQCEDLRSRISAPIRKKVILEQNNTNSMHFWAHNLES